MFGLGFTFLLSRGFVTKFKLFEAVRKYETKVLGQRVGLC